MSRALRRFVIVGGGIAGVSCAEQLAAAAPDDEITVISASPLIKAATNIRQISRALQEFDVEEQEASSLAARCPNVSVLQHRATFLDTDKQVISTDDGCTIPYDRMCVCTGADPKTIVADNPHVLGIRDTQSVQYFQNRLKGARRVVIVGNGGIATELAHEITGCEVVWAIKDGSIGSTFFDGGAAAFFLPDLVEKKSSSEASLTGHEQCAVFASGQMKRLRYSREAGGTAGSEGAVDERAGEKATGSALGPDWSENLPLHGLQGRHVFHQVHIEYNCEVRQILSADEFQSSGCEETASVFPHETSDVTRWPVYVNLTNDKIYGCDFVVSATGVSPRTDLASPSKRFRIADDGGLCVDSSMRTSVENVYAAGDVCSAQWDRSPHWFQMRLWSQARQMGAFAALCMAEPDGIRSSMDFCFELFAHSTRFFNYKVVLLGLFNAQTLGEEHELIVRCTKGAEYIKLVMAQGRLHGAVLIGETDLEETFENLILNQMDLSAFGESLLDPAVDLEDFFD